MSSSAPLKQAEDGDDIVVRLGRRRPVGPRLPGSGFRHGAARSRPRSAPSRSARSGSPAGGSGEAVETDLLERPLEPPAEGESARRPLWTPACDACTKQRRAPRPTETPMQRRPEAAAALGRRSRHSGDHPAAGLVRGRPAARRMTSCPDSKRRSGFTPTFGRSTSRRSSSTAAEVSVMPSSWSSIVSSMSSRAARSARRARLCRRLLVILSE